MWRDLLSFFGLLMVLVAVVGGVVWLVRRTDLPQKRFKDVDALASRRSYPPTAEHSGAVELDEDSAA